MSINLLPNDFDLLLTNAIQVFWHNRSTGSAAQSGGRGRVIDGKSMDGFEAVVRAVAEHCGIPQEDVFLTGKRGLVLPGYFRPCKNWDVVVIHRRRLIAALEFKSQVGSFGNNFNNRAEEVIGNGSDFAVAAKKGAYHPHRHVDRVASIHEPDPRPPFLGYLMLLQDCQKSRKPVKTSSPHYALLPGFENASYAKRYQILCERLMEQNLYQAASLMLTSEPMENGTSVHMALSPATDARNLFVKLAAELVAAAQT